jgi:hypothetical protein
MFDSVTENIYEIWANVLISLSEGLEFLIPFQRCQSVRDVLFEFPPPPLRITYHKIIELILTKQYLLNWQLRDCLLQATITENKEETTRTQKQRININVINKRQQENSFRMHILVLWILGNWKVKIRNGRLQENCPEIDRTLSVQ